MQYYGIDWLALACGLSGLYLIGSKNKYGFVLYMISSIGWVGFGVITSSTAIVIGNIIFFSLHLRGFINWNKVKE